MTTFRPDGATSFLRFLVQRWRALQVGLALGQLGRHGPQQRLLGPLMAYWRAAWDCARMAAHGRHAVITDGLSFNTDGGPEQNDRNRHHSDRP